MKHDDPLVEVQVLRCLKHERRYGVSVESREVIPILCCPGVEVVASVRMPPKQIYDALMDAITDARRKAEETS